ncbi:zinc carboxypeptidase-like [Littorina saxatilis]|uniref:zinc carboxypeptidase-like n=1 Tax=Littorina saxatilis TaxID=31220 RepID=UPI0038B4751F
MAYQGLVLPRCVVFFSVVTFSLCLPSLSERELSYEGFQVLRLQSDDPSLLVKTVRDLQQNSQVDLWSREQRSADIMVSPEELRHVRETSESQGIQHSLLIDDVHKYLELDYAARHQARHKRSVRDVTNSYMTFNEMTNYLNHVAWTSTIAEVTVSSIGRSFENKDVPVVELRERTTNRQPKRAILIEAGIHAREWMAVSMALNIINKLAYNPDNDPEVRELLEKFDWFVVPLVNPDGYVYSHSSSSRRLWRKTRTTEYSHTCPGVDGNRNFGYEWNPNVGGSRNPCANSFAGRNAFSEPETRNVRDWMKKHAENAAAYLSVHAFGEWVLYPFGSNKNEYLPDKALMQTVGNAFKSKLSQTGHSYSVGNSAALLYPAAGGSDDYAKGTLKIPVALTMEMSPKHQSQGGFMLPETLVYRTAQDTWPGFKAMAQTLHEQLESTSGTASHSRTDNTSGASSTAVSGTNNDSTNGLVAVNLNGQTLYLPANNPAIWQWLQYYYRQRSAGKH